MQRALCNGRNTTDATRWVADPKGLVKPVAQQAIQITPPLGCVV